MMNTYNVLWQRALCIAFHSYCTRVIMLVCPCPVSHVVLCCVCAVQSSLVVEVPPYHSKTVTSAAQVQFYVCNGKRKRSQSQRFTYLSGTIPDAFIIRLILREYFVKVLNLTHDGLKNSLKLNLLKPADAFFYGNNCLIPVSQLLHDHFPHFSHRSLEIEEGHVK